MPKTHNKIRWWLQEKMGKSVREKLVKDMSDEHKINERTVLADMNHGPVPPWRRNLWRKEIENVVGECIDELDIFPVYSEKDSFKVKEKEKVK